MLAKWGSMRKSSGRDKKSFWCQDAVATVRRGMRRIAMVVWISFSPSIASVAEFIERTESLSELCGTPDFDVREYNFNATTFWLSRVRSNMVTIPSIEHLIYNAAAASTFHEALVYAMLSACHVHECPTTVDGSPGFCNTITLASLIGTAVHDFVTPLKSYWAEVGEDADESVGQLGSWRGITDRYIGEVCSVLIPFVGELGGVGLPPSERTLACGLSALTRRWVCANVLRWVSAASQRYLFLLYAALINSQHGSHHTKPKVERLRYDPQVDCYGMCSVHGDIAARVLTEVGRPRPPAGLVHGVEIGTYLGRTALWLLKRVPSLHLLMVDPFDEVVPYEDGAFPYRLADSAFDRMHSALLPFRNRSQLIKQHSHMAGIWVKDEFFDVVIVDGDHSYEGCSMDVATWAPKLRRGAFSGIMVFHDYELSYPGVLKCVHEAAANLSDDQGLWLGPGFTAWFAVAKRVI